MKGQDRLIHTNRVRIYYYIGSISAITVVLILISVVYSNGLSREYERKIDQLSSGIINEKKRFLKNAIDRTISMIETEIKRINQENASKNLTQEQMKNLCVERVSERIRYIRLIDKGYIWVNRVVNYEGGDNYAVRQIHPNLSDTEGMRLSTNIKDIKGGTPYKVELDGIKKDGEIYFEYYFKKMDSNKIARKLTYAKLYKPWDWIIATGVYLEDVDQLISSETENMEKTLKHQTIYSFSIALIAFCLSTIILIMFEKYIGTLIRSYEDNIKNYTANLIKEKEKTERALAEVKQLKGLLPICSSCKKIRDDQGYWNHVELFIEKHSDASFSHAICPECLEKLYGNEDWYIDMKNKESK